MEDAIIGRILDLMNQAVEADSLAVTMLVNMRVTCNSKLGDHPTIQCGKSVSKARPATVGLLGILNGIGGVREDLTGYITAIADDEGMVIRFERTD